MDADYVEIQREVWQYIHRKKVPSHPSHPPVLLWLLPNLLKMVISAHTYTSRSHPLVIVVGVPGKDGCNASESCPTKQLGLKTHPMSAFLLSGFGRRQSGLQVSPLIAALQPLFCKVSSGNTEFRSFLHQQMGGQYKTPNPSS